MAKKEAFEIEITTLLKVLIENNMANAIEKAIEIQLCVTPQIPKEIPIQVSGKTLEENGLMWENLKRNDYGYINCKVIEHNPFQLSSPYKIEFPWGTEKWVSGNNNERTPNKFTEFTPEEKIVLH